MHQSPFILRDLTWEFYAGVLAKVKNVPDSTFSIVMGKVVSFFAERINEVLKLPHVEDRFEELVNNATTVDLERAKSSQCLPNAKWVTDNFNVFKVTRIALKEVMKDMSLWMMRSLLPINHNLYWHNERLLLLEAIVCGEKVNVGKMMEREIIACAKRSVGSLFPPNLIRLLCEDEEVDRFDEYEEEYPLAPEIDLKFGGVGNVEEEAEVRVQEKKGEKKKETTKVL